MNELDESLREFLQINRSEKSTLRFEDEANLIATLSQRIKELMAQDFESLMSMMYRLDIDESKIKQALAPGNVEDPSVSLAKIIIERQKRRMETKSKYQQPPLSDFIDFE